jgi:hypothetical protein
MIPEAIKTGALPLARLQAPSAQLPALCCVQPGPREVASRLPPAVRHEAGFQKTHLKPEIKGGQNHDK